MDKELIKRIILENQKLVREAEIVRRDFDIIDGVCYVFVGLRRAGKSYLLYQQIQNLIAAGHRVEEMLYFNFEDDRLEQLSLGDLDQIKTCYEEMYAFRPILLLDEIQNVEGWERFARRMADQKYTVYITGSNSRMLSTEIAGTLGGRYMIQSVFPYSFGEYLRATGVELDGKWPISPKKNEVVRHLSDYFTCGGLPETVNIPRELRRPWLSNLFNKIFFGDLLARYSIRNSLALKVLLRKMAESVKQPCSLSHLANIVTSTGIKTRPETVADYLQYAEESCLIFSIENYATKIVERMSNKKYYFADNGLLSLFLFDPASSLMENIVAVELHRRQESVCYYLDSNAEVDFFLWERDEAIQVAYSLKDEKTRKREIDALIRLNKRIPLRRMTIVTYDDEDVITQSNLTIEVVPLWRWLLQ